MRIVRVPIYHEGTYRALVRGAEAAAGCLRHGGRYWEAVERGRGFAIYRRAEHDLAWLQQRVEDYEAVIYGQLLSGFTGRDGQVRPRSRVRIGPAGVRRGR